MNVLFIADPNSIHDRRWINAIVKNRTLKAFVLWRSSHRLTSGNEDFAFNGQVIFLTSIEDPSVIRPWRNVFELLKIREIIKTHKIDILHVLYAEPNALWLYWKRFLKVTSVVTTRGTDILQTIPRFFAGRSILDRIVASRYRISLNHADHIFCTSSRQIESLRSLSILSRANVVRTGIDFGHRSDVESCHVVKGLRRRFILMPRSMKPIYNHEFTLDAIALLPEWVRREFSFVFVNADTSCQAYFRAVHEKAHSISADIHFLPSLSHECLVATCRASALIIMNPLSDGSPVTAMEAMACRTPLILPPLRYDEELFASVWFFEKWTPKSLSDTIERVLTLDSDTLTFRLEASFLNVMEKANTDAEMQKVVSVYAELLSIKHVA